MPIHVALLRAINVVGRNNVAMTDLRELFADLGFKDIRTVLQSGNVVFDTDGKSSKVLERLLEEESASRLGLTVDYFIRSAAQWIKVAAGNPFLKEARTDPSRLLTMFLKSVPTAQRVRDLEAAIQGRERIHGDGKQLYIVYPDGVGRSKFTSNLIERMLGTRGTARNWNTVLRLAALCE